MTPNLSQGALQEVTSAPVTLFVALPSAPSWCFIGPTTRLGDGRTLLAPLCSSDSGQWSCLYAYGAGRKDVCWPRQAVITKECRLYRETAIVAVTRLIALGTRAWLHGWRHWPLSTSAAGSTGMKG